MVSIAIQAHPDRQELAEALRASLSGAEIVWDPDPDAVLRSPWRTYEHALRTAPADASHRLIVQDDVKVAKGLVEVLPAIAAECPDVPVTLFVAGLPRTFAIPLFTACDQGRRYCELPTRPWVPVIATMWPTKLIPALLSWVEAQQFKAHFVSDDDIMGKAMSGLGIRLFATVPSLVDHPDEVESLLGTGRSYAGLNQSRVAACFLDDDLDARDFDW